MNLNNITNLIPEGVSAGIYKITAPDGHYYIGSAKDLKTRFRRHSWDLKNNRHHNKWMQRIYNKHINEVWSMELLEAVKDDTMLELKEDVYIREHYGKPGCINVSMSAYRPVLPVGVKRTDEVKARMSLAQKGKPKPWKRGIPRTDETKTKLSKANLGKKLSTETRLKMSESRRKITTFYHPLYGEHKTYAKKLINMFPFLNLKTGGLANIRDRKTTMYKGWTILNIISETQA